MQLWHFVVLQTISPTIAAVIGSIWTFGCFYISASRKSKQAGIAIYKEDKSLGWRLSKSAIFMLFYFSDSVDLFLLKSSIG